MVVAHVGGGNGVSSLRAEYTFERFIKGDGNEMACSACQAVADSPGKAFNPLFIYGKTGLGKTHLLQAIGNEVLSKQPAQRVIYISSEQFTTDFVRAILEKHAPRFRGAFRQADILLIDDVHFLQNKEGTQEELFHTFNELHAKGKQIVLSSDRPPEELSQMPERLVSRFDGGMVADVQPPNYETRLAILSAKAVENGLKISDEILALIAKRIDSSVRALEGALIKVTAHTSFQGQPLTPAALDKILPVCSSRERHFTIEMIKAEVASRYGITVEQLVGQNREKRIVQVRHIAMYLARELTNNSFPAIGEAFGKRDHTTVMHAHGKVCELIQAPLFRIEIEQLKQHLNGLR